MDETLPRSRGVQVVGLLGRQAWAWYLGLLISLSGIAVIGLGLLSRDAPLPLVSPLVTDVLITIVLRGARPRTSGLRPARGENRR